MTTWACAARVEQCQLTSTRPLCTAGPAAARPGRLRAAIQSGLAASFAEGRGDPAMGFTGGRAELPYKARGGRAAEASTDGRGSTAAHTAGSLSAGLAAQAAAKVQRRAAGQPGAQVQARMAPGSGVGQAGCTEADASKGMSAGAASGSENRGGPGAQPERAALQPKAVPFGSPERRWRAPLNPVQAQGSPRTADAGEAASASLKWIAETQVLWQASCLPLPGQTLCPDVSVQVNLFGMCISFDIQPQLSLVLQAHRQLLRRRLSSCQQRLPPAVA